MSKSLSSTKVLEKKYGGVWAYIQTRGEWCCEDGRKVKKIKRCNCADVCDHPPAYYLYGDNRKPEYIGYKRPQ